MRAPRFMSALGLTVVTLLAVSACSASSGTPKAAAAPSARATTVSVVTSTSVYGDIARTVGGAGVRVTSIVTDPAADPHSFEASAQTVLALSRADVVIENGGGYDPFMDSLLAAASKKPAAVLNAVQIAGKSGPGLNEHVWYDFPSIRALTRSLVQALSRAAPAQSDYFAANAAAFTDKLATLERTAAQIAAGGPGRPVAITEPLPLYLLQAAGLDNKTPPEFAKAIEEGTDVSPRILQTTLDLFTNREVDALVYNEQTSGPETTKVLRAATANGIPVVPVTETLPRAATYVSWMTANLTALKKALR
jgi:zinc/manganese transport system substrate-binding protein